MAMTMNPSKGNEGSEDRFQADPGTYQFKLVEIVLDQGTDFDDKSIKFPQARLVWEDEDGDKYHDSFVRIPKGFQLNDKAKWTNRLSALVGRPLTDEDAMKFNLDLGEDINSYDDLCEAVGEKQDNGRPVTLKVLALDYEGVTLFGRTALLTLGVNAKGYNTCGANGAAPLPSSGGKKKRAATTDVPF